MQDIAFLTVLLNALLFAGLPWMSRAQQRPPAQCNSATGFDWTFNSKKQSPCDVGGYLGGVCNAGNFTLPALNPGESYLGPALATANACRCSTVFYSLLSACAACQDRAHPKWSIYSKNCSNTYTNFPEDIPEGTAVPGWAYVDVKPSDDFVPAQAQALANAPESTGTPKPTQPNTPSALASPSGTSNPTSQSEQSSGSKSNTGAIVGGVVGGIAGLAILALLAFWLMRRRKSRPRVVSDIDAPFDVNTGNLPTSPDFTRVGSPFSLDTQTAPKPRIYNPSDPTTFPDALGYQSQPQPQPQTPGWHDSSYPVSQHFRSHSDDSVQPGNASVYSTPSHRRNFSGAAEVQI